MPRFFSDRAVRILALVFLLTTVTFGTGLAATWVYFSRLTLKPPDVPLPEQALKTPPPASTISPLLVLHKLDLPGRGEIFPALTTGAADYWPLAVLTITNQSDNPVLETISAQVPGVSLPSSRTVIIGPRETRSLHLSPELLPDVYSNEEIQRTVLQVRAVDTMGSTAFAQDSPVFLHAASDLFWGKKFGNAQYVARWVTPHDPSVLRIVSLAKRANPKSRFAGYNTTNPNPAALSPQVRQQADAVFRSLRQSGIGYVSSIFTFGNFVGQAQRIRFPRETLSLNAANCIDVSVVFASAMENLGMKPVIVILPGHAITGV
ncbi:MAG: hypothetical protein JWN45_92, partial [Acidobacteriaceae bacterium]|nr:hypothetical protein [Acidobacteriaceae bacterium]